MVAAHSISKRSPFVLVRNLLFIEILFSTLYYLGTLSSPEAKLEIFRFFFFSHFLSYQAFKPFFLSAIQFVTTIYVFLRWYYESYTLRPAELSHRRGVFFKRERVITLDPATRVSVSRKLFSRFFHYGNVIVRNARGKTMTVSNVSRPDEFANKIEEAIMPIVIASPSDVVQLLTHDEYDQLEFKSSLRVDKQTKRINRGLERAAMKTIAAFLNSSGGYLVIGVDDAHQPVGLHDDYKTLQRRDADGFENHFTMLFNTMIGADFRHLIKLQFHPIRDVDVCVVQVAAGHKPAYVKSDNKEEFFIRTGNTTTSLTFSELDAYRRSRWPA